MMNIKLVRIDDRLIHGQVATSWLRHVNAEQIICVDDKAANDPLAIQVLKMAVPDLRVHVFGVDKFIEITKTNPIKRSTFLLLTSTVDVLKLVEAGIDISEVNYGGMRSRKDRVSYSHDLSFSPQEEESLLKLLDMGVKVDYRIAAFDQGVPVLDKLKEAKEKYNA